MPVLVRSVLAQGYRTLRAIRFPVERLTVFLGANGVGKTNLYRGLQLIQAAASGRLSQEIAAEGGMESALWAGDRQRKAPAQITLGSDFAAVAGGAVDYSYAVKVGLRTPTAAAFAFEPQIKEETLAFHNGRRQTLLLERRGPHVVLREESGKRVEIKTELLASETALGSIQDPADFPDLHMIRRTILDWRFYHEMRTDEASPLRRPCLAVTSPTLASDGANLAAVFATLAHIREDRHDLDGAIEDAFPGARLVVPSPQREAGFGMIFPEHPSRIFDARELSDGTLRYLALAGALLAYRLPAFVALNEPETSLHPDLLRPLARLILHASERSQIWLVTHSKELAGALAEQGAVSPRIVVKRAGETWIEGLRASGELDAAAEPS